MLPIFSLLLSKTPKFYIIQNNCHVKGTKIEPKIPICLIGNIVGLQSSVGLTLNPGLTAPERGYDRFRPWRRTWKTNMSATAGEGGTGQPFTCLGAMISIRIDRDNY